jgi:hypothetical protein
VAAAGIPEIGGGLINPIDYASPDVVALTPGSAAVFGCVPFYLKLVKHISSTASLILDIADEYTLNNTLKSAARAAGVKYSGTVAAPLTSTDFSPYVAKAKSLGVGALTVATSFPDVQGVIQSESSLGMNTFNMAVNATATDSDLAAFGSVATPANLGLCSPVPPASATNIPAIKKFNDAMDGAHLSGKGPITIQAYLSMYAMQSLAKRVSGPVTGKSLLAVARTAKNVDVLGLFKWNPGIRGPASYPNATSGLCWLLQAQGGHWTLVQNAPIDVWKLMGIGS